MTADLATRIPTDTTLDRVPLRPIEIPPWQAKPGREWLLEITSDANLDMDAFRKAIQFPGIETFSQLTRTFVRTDRVQHLSHPGEVKEIGEELLEVLNGIVRVECPYYRGIKLKGLIRVFQDGTSQGIVDKSFEVYGLNEIKSFREYIGSATSHAEAMDALANSDGNVREALRVFSLRDDPFMNLYKVFEIIREDLGAIDAITHHLGISKARIKHFTGTANHSESIGRQSRHARSNGVPVKMPMPPSDARELLRSMMCGWIMPKLAK
jgi:hypothetical protein